MLALFRSHRQWMSSVAPLKYSVLIADLLKTFNTCQSKVTNLQPLQGYRLNRSITSVHQPWIAKNRTYLKLLLNLFRAIAVQWEGIHACCLCLYTCLSHSWRVWKMLARCLCAEVFVWKFSRTLFKIAVRSRLINTRPVKRLNRSRSKCLQSRWGCLDFRIFRGSGCCVTSS